MALASARRNAIAWKYLVQQIKERGLHKIPFDSPQTRQQIRETAEKIDIPFEDAMEFVKEILEEVKK